MKLDAQRGRHLENGRQAGVALPREGLIQALPAQSRLTSKCDMPRIQRGFVLFFVVNCSDVHGSLLGSGQSLRASGRHNGLVSIHIDLSFKGCKGG